RISTIKDKEVSVGNRVKVKVVKNKLSAPFKQVEFDLLFEEGISQEGDIIDLALAEKLIQKSGAWFSYEGENIGQGRENTRQFLKANPEVTQRLRETILSRKNITLGSGDGADSEMEEAVADE
ncbi:MAG: hypothetical protein RLZZ303_2258, partial [Candidatus Hydrogenedentota bacterium]